MTQISLAALNTLPEHAFDAVIAPLFENAPWITAGLAALRPFASLTALHAAAVARLQSADDNAKLAFLRGHPSLSPATLRAGTTPDSTAEQVSAGINALDDAGAARLDAANAAHLARFGVPFILAIRYASLSTIHAAMRRRAAGLPGAEIAEALREVQAISWMRLLDRVTPAPTGGISTHVLDTVRTAPCAGLSGELWHLPPDATPCCAARFITDGNGRAETMLGDGKLAMGSYDLRFDTAAYLAGSGAPTWERSFFPMVTVRFAVMNPEEHFHVPVLLSNGAYTAYRGS